jgi:hypothetical protein
MSDLALSSAEGTSGTTGADGGSTTATGTVSTVGTQSTSSGGDQSSSSAVNWESILSQAGTAPPEVIQKILETHPEVAKTATRNVRKTEIQRQAETLAEQLAAAKQSSTLQQLEAIRRERDMLVARSREQLLSTMTDQEQEAFKLKEQLATRDAEVNYYRTVFSQREEQEAKSQILRVAQEDWGLDDDDVKQLEATDSVDKFVNTALKLSGAKRKKMADETRTLAEKIDALSRVVNGTSVHAATAHASSGGDMSFEDAEAGFLDGRVSFERYMDARKKAGIR